MNWKRRSLGRVASSTSDEPTTDEPTTDEPTSETATTEGHGQGNEPLPATGSPPGGSADAGVGPSGSSGGASEWPGAPVVNEESESPAAVGTTPETMDAHPIPAESVGSDTTHGSEVGSPTPERPIPVTRTGTIWASLIFGIVALVVVLIFILQNGTSVTIHFITLSANLPLGVALLFGAILGALVVLLLGAARVLQLRRLARRRSRVLARQVDHGHRRPRAA